MLNADGGTRCASITAASIAMRLCVRRLIASGRCLPADKRLSPRANQVRNGSTYAKCRGSLSTRECCYPHDLAAISVGLIDGDVYTDLDYILDSNADVDMNVVMTADGKFVEVQGTGEEFTYTGRTRCIIGCCNRWCDFSQ